METGSPIFSVNYKELLLKLLPRGKAWKVEEGSIFDKLLSALAVQLKRVDSAVSKIAIEADPRTAVDTLSDWEAQYGLPDECSVLASTVAERRANLLAKITAVGGQSEAYFKSLGASPIAISYGSPSTLPMNVSGTVRGVEFKHVWYVPAVSGTEYFEAGDPVDTPVSAIMDSSRFQCLIEKNKPAHTYVIYQ